MLCVTVYSCLNSLILDQILAIIFNVLNNIHLPLKTLVICAYKLKRFHVLFSIKYFAVCASAIYKSQYIQAIFISMHKTNNGMIRAVNDITQQHTIQIFE